MARTRVLKVLACLLTVVAIGRFLRGEEGGQEQAPTGPYTLLDKVEDGWVNRNPIPYRPMVAMADDSVWTVNPYLSEVVHLVKDSGSFDYDIPSDGRFRTLPGPVSIARYQPTTGNMQLLVVCQHANAVAVHDATNGDMLGIVAVPAGPGDILVDQTNHRAWVSCAQADKVVTINLTSREIGTTFDTWSLSRSPGFLSMHGGQVLVAPRISGNGSVVDRKDFTRGGDPLLNGAQDFDEHAGERGILDTLVPTVASTGLPDNDLLWLDLGTSTAKPVARSTGTLLFAHAVQPGSDPATLWQLNLDANNKNPTRQSEPSIKGEIVFNRLTKVQLPTLSGTPTPAAPLQSIYLDTTTAATSEVFPDTAYATGTAAIGTPYSLAFKTDGSACAIAGLMSDNVILVDGSGARTGVLELQESPTDDPSTMPRQVLALSDGTLAVWGANLTAHFFENWSTSNQDVVDLGFDPTPSRIQLGRKLFFDASNSQRGNASCASCHDEGKTDMLAWNLSEMGDDDEVSEADGFDNKGPMVTQTLVGIAEAVPFHWRGEQLRGLVDFNAAFVNLLGGDDLDVTFEPDGSVTPDSEFGRFQAFVLSLTEDANQFQHRNRVISDGIKIQADPAVATARAPNPSNLSAITGQSQFATRCGGCHAFPNGTSNEVVDNAFGGEANSDMMWLKVGPFQAMQTKFKQHLVDVTFATGTGFPDTQAYPILGAGLSHAGTVRDILPFMEILLRNDVATEFKEQRNIASFIRQWDTGTAPACHVVQFMNAANADAVIDTATSNLNWLINQADTSGPQKRNCDIAVIGRLASLSASNPFYGWIYDRKLGTPARFFGPDENGQGDAARDLEFFRDAAENGGWFAFIGMPVGTGWKFGVDFDGDQVPNHLEGPAGFDDELADTDGNGFLDGVEFYFGGDPPINAAPDEDLPQIVGTTPDFQWVTQKVARLTFETDELTTAELTLTKPGGQVYSAVPNLTVKEDVPKMQHNLLVTGLVWPVPYTVQLKIKDLGDFSPPSTFNPPQEVTIPLANLSMGTRVPAPVTATNAFLRIGALTAATPQPNGTKWDFAYTVTVVDGGVLANGNPRPVQDVWVAARAMIDGIPATDAVFDEDPRQTPKGTTFDVEGVHYTPTGFVQNEIVANDDIDGDTLVDPEDFPPVNVPGAIPGPYAIGFDPNEPVLFEPTNASGVCTVRFTLDLGNPAPTGTRVTLSIEAMGPRVVLEPNGRINMDGNGSFGRFTDQHDGDGDVYVGPPLETETFNGGGGQVPSFFAFPRTPAQLRRLDWVYNGTTWVQP